MYLICAALLLLTLYAYHVQMRHMAQVLKQKLKEHWFKMHLQYPAWRHRHEQNKHWQRMLPLMDRLAKLDTVQYAIKFRQRTAVILSVQRFYCIGNAAVQGLQTFLSNPTQVKDASHESSLLPAWTMYRQLRTFKTAADKQCYLHYTNPAAPEPCSCIVLVKYRLKTDQGVRLCRHMYVLNANSASVTFPPRATAPASASIIWDCSMCSDDVTELVREYSGVNRAFDGMSMQELQLALLLETTTDCTRNITGPLIIDADW